ncbi:MAG: hypothetical protein SOZ81_00630 [Agathobacter sp.]|nr:hypothetical protein [Agathobacter sp.]
MGITEDIRNYLTDNYGDEVTFAEIAPNSTDSQLKAIDFDNVKRKIVGDKCESADALYITNSFNFIEFKTGFASEKTDINTKTHKENLKLKIRLKAFETMALFRDVIIPSLGANERMIIGKRRYIAVIDSKEKPTDAYQDVLAEISGTQDNISEYKKSIFIWLTDSLAVYRRELDGKKLFYDYTDVWYDFEFDNKIELL